MTTATPTEVAAHSKQPVVSSIGLNPQGKSVVRIVMPDMKIIDIDTNLVSFAKLAALGVRVINDRGAK